MQVEPLSIADVKLITPRRFQDDRGFFSETWSARVWEDAGLEANFVQDNHAYSVAKGVVRGLHFQLQPAAQGKLVRVTRGAILDVAVDIRRGSSTFGRHVSAVLSADNWAQLWVPEGFAHGYITLQPETEVVYKVTFTLPLSIGAYAGMIQRSASTGGFPVMRRPCRRRIASCHCSQRRPTSSEKNRPNALCQFNLCRTSAR